MKENKGVRLLLSKKGLNQLVKNVKELLNLDIHDGTKNLLEDAEKIHSKNYVLVKWKDLVWHETYDDVSVLYQALQKLEKQGYSYELCVMDDETYKHEVKYTKEEIPNLSVEKMHNDELTMKDMKFYDAELQKEELNNEEMELE